MTKKKTMLYVEDDSEMQGLIMDILDYEGIEVIMDTGKNLYRSLDEHEVGMILMDENLRWCQGSDLCKQLKSLSNYQHVPVIMISGLWDIPSIALECGADGYIRKPFDMYDIMSTINLHYAHS